MEDITNKVHNLYSSHIITISPRESYDWLNILLKWEKQKYTQNFSEEISWKTEMEVQK
jgi:hypothetical protein